MTRSREFDGIALQSQEDLHDSLLVRDDGVEAFLE